MCICDLSVYPCGHTVLVSHEPCVRGMHPRNCARKRIQVRLSTHRAGASCPGSGTHPCLVLPATPALYAQATAHMDLAEALTRLPIWIYDPRGAIIGTKNRPHYLEEYTACVAALRLPPSAARGLRGCVFPRLHAAGRVASPMYSTQQQFCARPRTELLASGCGGGKRRHRSREGGLLLPVEPEPLRCDVDARPDFSWRNVCAGLQVGDLASENLHHTKLGGGYYHF